MAVPGLRLPQMGWNALDFVPGSHKLLDGLLPGDHVYFVHSYALLGGNLREAIAMTDYGGPVVAMVASAIVPARSSMSRRARRSVSASSATSCAGNPDAMADEAPPLPAQRLVERVTEFTDDDLHALCEATAAAIIDGGGFGWVSPPGMMALETYFRGVLLVPERELFLARLNGLVVGSAHLVRPPRNNEAQGHAAHSCTPTSRPTRAATAWHAC